MRADVTSAELSPPPTIVVRRAVFIFVQKMKEPMSYSKPSLNIS